MTRSKDGAVRRADIRYFNYGETNSRITDRAVRSICRLFNIEDNYFVNDMNEVGKFIKSMRTQDDAAKDAPSVAAGSLENYHCCTAHQSFSMLSRGKFIENLPSSLVGLIPVQEEFPSIYEQFLYEEDDFDYSNVQIKSSYATEDDALFDAMTSLQTDFNLE